MPPEHSRVYAWECLCVHPCVWLHVFMCVPMSACVCVCVYIWWGVPGDVTRRISVRKVPVPSLTSGCRCLWATPPHLDPGCSGWAGVGRGKAPWPRKQEVDSQELVGLGRLGSAFLSVDHLLWQKSPRDTEGEAVLLMVSGRTGTVPQPRPRTRGQTSGP